MKKSRILITLLLGAVIVLLGSNLINGLLWGILKEWYFDVARTSYAEWEWLYGGAKFVASAKTALIHLVLVAVWFGAQLLVLLKSKSIAFRLTPITLTVFLWFVSEVMNVLWGNREVASYVLCAVALHGMFGTWVAWTMHVLFRKEED